MRTGAQGWFNRWAEDRPVEFILACLIVALLFFGGMVLLFLWHVHWRPAMRPLMPD